LQEEIYDYDFAEGSSSSTPEVEEDPNPSYFKEAYMFPYTEQSYLQILDARRLKTAEDDPSPPSSPGEIKRIPSSSNKSGALKKGKKQSSSQRSTSAAVGDSDSALSVLSESSKEEDEVPKDQESVAGTDAGTEDLDDDAQASDSDMRDATPGKLVTFPMPTSRKTQQSGDSADTATTSRAAKSRGKSTRKASTTKARATASKSKPKTKKKR